MHAEDIQRLTSLDGDSKLNIKAKAADEILTSVYASLHKTEKDIDAMLDADYNEQDNDRLMKYLTTLRHVNKVTSTLDTI